MPSFDVVSEVDPQEITNAVDQCKREVGTRFDFKGTKAGIEQTGSDIILHGDNEFQIGQVRDILLQKIAKRGIDIAALQTGAVEEGGGEARQKITVRQGIDQDTGKKIVKIVKSSKMKVQASIQGDQVRISGKKRDDLQDAIAMLKKESLNLPLQFTNFRD